MLRAPMHHASFEPVELAARKHERALRVSVCVPARDEASTIAGVVEQALALKRGPGFVDEVIVVDDGSRDATARVARDAGASVVAAGDVLPNAPRGDGKGDAMWRSLYVSRGDLVCWMDGDVKNPEPWHITGLIGPLIVQPDIGFVKGFYRRPLDGRSTGGGRVTELMARPLIGKLFPHLGGVVQPLAGAQAGRRDLLERVPFVAGWGVELALLVDIVARFGPACLAQTDLGVVHHRNKALHALAPESAAILAVALQRAGLDGSGTWELMGFTGESRAAPSDIDVVELPPIASVRG